MHTMTPAFWRARDAFFEHDGIPDPQVIPPVVIDSWRRSRDVGLRPDSVRPVSVSEVDPDHLLLRAARPVVSARLENLADMPCGVAVTDHEGTVLDTYGSNRPFTTLMRETDCVPGFRLAEHDFGTLSPGLSLVLDSAVLLVGGQHFSELAHGRSSAGVPLHHPSDGRVLGTINFACELEFTTPVMLHWAKELARLVQGQLVESLESTERALLRAYLSRSHTRRGPVVYVSEKSFIASAPASRLARRLDRSFVAELASSLHNGPRTGAVNLRVRESDATIPATWETVENGGRAVGIALHLTSPTTQRQPRPLASRAVQVRERDADELESTSTPPLPGLVGTGPAWRTLVTSVAAWDGSTPLLVVGEPGTGKSAIVEQLRGRNGVIVDVAELADGPDGWLATVTDALGGRRSRVVLQDVHLLSEADVMAVCDLAADAASRGVTVLATWSVPANHDFADSDGQPGPASWPGTTVFVPPLRERLEDVPDLVRALATQRRTWAPETLLLLRRVTWPDNLHSLRGVVAEVLRRQAGPVVRPADLPASVRRLMTRRELTGLERVEADAITRALDSAAGNKRLAAQTLGISRSSLHRKLRAYGIHH
ncbi:helix-turn-helix domain-containing protein [Georgenia sp. SYP-B2076]|uniref:helix-turn-helix domain-containing protein n=1 Tax=Georgenia sp. SYP-B2076 TaxID=2495881 RepID=UPI0013E02996|nr:helix-turn-helix domain-containing protein [Georgenia sp. SYP-B2076]